MRTLLLRVCMLSVTLMVTNMYCLILSHISFEAQPPFVMQIWKCGRQMNVHSCADPLMDGNSVSYVRTALRLGKSYRTSRSCIHLRRLSMLFLKVLNVNLYLSSGFHFFWKSVRTSFLLSNRGARTIWNATRIMEWIYPKRWRRR